MVIFNVNGETFRVYKIALRVIGVWPLDRHQRGSAITFYVTLLIEAVTVLTCMQRSHEKCHPDHFRNDRHRRIAAIINGIVHQIYLRVYGFRMKPLIETSINDWLLIRDVKARDIMKRHNRSGTFLIFAHGLVFYAFVPMWNFASSMLINEFVSMDERQTCAFADGFIWDYLIPVLSWIIYLFCSITSSGGFILFWSLALHLSGQYKILKKRFQDFLLLKGRNARLKKFGQLVERHNQLLDLTGRFEESFTVYVAIHVFALQLYTCLIVLQLAIGIEGLDNFPPIFRVPVLTCIITILYMYYFAGNYLTMCSIEIAEAFTECNWYDLSKESITNFSIVIARCQMPKTLTAIKMYKLNLSNFKYVVNALYSYISCMVMVKNKNK